MRKNFLKFTALTAIVLCCAGLLAGCKADVRAEFSEENFAATAKIKCTDTETVLTFGREIAFNTVVLGEKADRVTLFRMYVRRDGEYSMFYEQDRIDRYRLCAFPEARGDALKIEIVSASGKTALDFVEVYDVRPKTREFRVAAYMTADNKSVRNRKTDPGFTGYFNAITDVIIIGKARLSDDGKAIEYGEGEDDFAADIAALREASGGRATKIRVSVGVKRQDSAATAVFIETHIEAIKRTLADFTEKYALAGLDFDWEYPENARQWRAYGTLIEGTADALAPLGATVSVALAPWGVNLSQRTIAKIDFVNLMAYDLFDDRGEHAAIYQTGAEAVAETERMGFRREQIFLGLSFYGRTADRSGDAWPDYAWDYEKNGASLGQWGNKIPDYAYVTADGQAKSSDGYVNGYAMNRDKTAYAIAADLGGVMIFRSKCDAPYTYEFSLHRAVEEALKQRLNREEKLAKI